MERRIAIHLDGRTRVMSQDENGHVVRRVVTPPALPVQIGPRTANRSEHVPPQNPRSDVPESPRGKIVVDPVVPSPAPWVRWNVRVGMNHWCKSSPSTPSPLL